VRALSYLALGAVLTAGCGRIGFDARVDATVDATLDDADGDLDADATADAVMDATVTDGTAPSDAVADAAPDARMDVRTGLVLELTFESSATMDSSGGANDARCVDGCPDLVPMGVVDGALHFSGGGEHLLVDDDGTFALEGAFTLALWVRLDAAAGRTCFFTKPIGGSSSNSFAFCADDLVPFFYVCGASCDFLRSPAAVVLDRWFHLAATHDGTMQRFYLDGAEVEARSGSVSFDGDPLVLGGDVDGSFGYAMSGSVDEVRIYDRALSVAEIGILATSP
jgi:hypothetical protein